MSRIITLGAALVATGCSFTLTPLEQAPEPEAATNLKPPAAVNTAGLDAYRSAIAQHITVRNPQYVLRGTPQAMLRSLVVVAFTIDRNGHVIRSTVYRTNGDGETEEIALATLRHASPLPQPPAKLLNGRGQLELMEEWLFNDNGKFQLRELAAPQAQNYE